jgi:probable HAF family extracellular repeat protein
MLLPLDSGWHLLSARGINNAGQIVGYGNHNGAYHAFLLTPDDAAAVHGRPRLDPLAAQRLGEHFPLAPAVLESVLPDSRQPANHGQSVTVETGRNPVAEGTASVATPTASLGHQATDAAYLEPGVGQPGDLLTSPWGETS